MKETEYIHNGRSGSSTVVDFGTNRNLVCYFLFVTTSNSGYVSWVGNLAQRAHPQNSGGIRVMSLFSTENLQYLWTGQDRTKVTIDD